MKIELEIIQGRVQFLNDDSQKWVCLNFTNLYANIINRPADITFSSKLQAVQLIHESNPFFKKMISSEILEEKPIVKFKVEIQSKDSPKYQVTSTFSFVLYF
jgi:hypothetical protein